MNGLTLLHPERWWALLVVPLLVVLLVWDRRRRARRREAYADPKVAPLVFDRVPRPGTLRAISLAIGSALLLFSLMEPSWGRLPLPVSKRGADIVFCLDLSRSMRTRDIPGGREKRARLDLLSILDKLGGNRVALVGFAKSARIFCPLTHDAKAFRFLLERAKEDEVEQGPTDLGAALRASLTLLPETEGNYQAVVLLSDGEDLVQSVDQVIPILARRGVPLHTIGYGTVQGAPIPDASGMDVLRDEKGKPIISHMDVETLRRLADRTGGTFLAANDNPLPLVELWNKRILAMQTRETQKGMRTIPISRFQWFLLPGFLLLVFGLRPRGSRNGGGKKGEKGKDGQKGGNPARKVAAAAFLPLFFFQGGELRKGVELLRKGEAKKAFQLLEKARAKGLAAGPTLLLDHAIAAFRAGKTEDAIASAEKLVARAGTLRPERDLIVGTARLKEALEAFAGKDLKGAEEKTRRALAALEDAVVARPAWKEARENLERAWRLLRQIQEKKKQKNEKQNKKQNKDNKKKQDQKKNRKQQQKNQKRKKDKNKKQKNKQKQQQNKEKRKQAKKKPDQQKNKQQKKSDQQKQKEKQVPKARKKSEKKNEKKQEPKEANRPKARKKKQPKPPKAQKKSPKKKPQKQRSKPKPSRAIPMRLSPEERAQLEKKLQRLLLEARKNRKPAPSKHVPGKKDW